jgi:hypothetical protein
MKSVRARALSAVVVAACGFPAGLLLAGVNNLFWSSLAIAFLLTAPAMATMALLPSLDSVSRIVCGFAAAVVLDGVVAQVMLAMNVWSIPGGATAVAVVSASLWMVAAGPLLRTPGRGSSQGNSSSSAWNAEPAS